MTRKVRIIGAGLAGSEAAIYLAKKGYEIDLFEMRPKYKTGAHTTDYPAELVCSNSLGSLDILSASGLLKEEATRLGSTLFEIAKKCAVPSGNSLSIDRFGFCEEVKKIIDSYKNIKLINEKYEKIDASIPTIIATGPLSAKELAQNIKEEFGNDNFHFFDAIAPIVEKDSIDFSKAFWASRWDKGSADFINCPMNKEEYENFYEILTTAQRAPLHDFEAGYFEGCMPIEVMASRGVDTLRFGPMKPVGLFDKRIPTEFKKNQFYAVVQLRQDDKMANLYNLVGFQTNLKWGEQKKLINSIPGLENAKIVRYGVMHANTFIDSPKILNKHLQTNKYENIFFAGQLTGVEGYCESISTGLFAAINLDRMLKNKPLIQLNNKTMLGALIEYITFKEHKTLQPINSNWGIVEEVEGDKKKLKDKNYKNQIRSQKALNEIENITNILKEE
ncbi:methylenetetrahydrofolate--tRNA-(uracil(54)-C(5))-methyltransferase (FADH(2)-oxidizing) TrmFO [bacterium]|nr:methylenetetrahydrofolate--tRNA-(uracil(54)-C(5))-methyltransferase (FADH(2)-oxidizing) TrmFO [bacterium]MBQ9149767.1 methylenetetrahydrofolate--tRNA-(uracil(54)-C(5))-methyltransferase (FADH(2)-oxidizing) TrmFO [bacterium]